MVTSNAGARSIVFTSPKAKLSETMEVNEKNPAPKVEKKVFDKDDLNGDVTEDGGSWKDVNDAKIGDVVKFKITVELYKGAENIIVYDNMSDGLTFKAIEGVKFFPRSGATEFSRVVYELGTKTDTNPANGLELAGKTDVYRPSTTEHAPTAVMDALDSGELSINANQGLNLGSLLKMDEIAGRRQGQKVKKR